jgi:hypothetical protein
MNRWLTLAAMVSGTVLIVPLAAWYYDRSQMILWDGSTDLEVVFEVTDAESGQPIKNARIIVRVDEGNYDGVVAGKSFELTTDASGLAIHMCRDQWCSGKQSRLSFTDTRHVFVPVWSFRVFAKGYASQLWEELNVPGRGDQVQQLGVRSDKLVVPISRTKVREH